MRLECAKQILDAIKQAIFIKYANSPKLKQLQGGIAKHVASHIHDDLQRRGSNINLDFMYT